FGYRRYVEWVLDVPMFFVVRAGQYRPARGITFRHFLESGLDGERATIADWERHLTTVFPEVRLKKVLEMRGADAVPPGLTCSLPALWKGLLYDAEARVAAWERLRIHPLAAREAARLDVARRGPACARPRRWRGRLDDAEARPAAGEPRRTPPPAARGAARLAAARRARAARCGDEPVLEVARDLAQIARDGLRRLRHRPSRA